MLPRTPEVARFLSGDPAPNEWYLQDAQKRFSDVVDTALSGEPQMVTPKDKPSVVLLAMKEYEQMINQGLEKTPSFVEHLLSVPKDDEYFERWMRWPFGPSQ